MNMKFGVAAMLAASLALAGCGTMPGDRALSGGLLGAGTGAAIGSLAGSAGEGALIGGLGGLAIGALTSPDALNLGDPPWRHSGGTASRRTSSKVASAKCTTRETATQRVTTCNK